MNSLLTLRVGDTPGPVAARQAGAIAVLVRAPPEAEETAGCVGELLTRRLRRAGLEAYLVFDGA